MTVHNHASKLSVYRKWLKYYINTPLVKNAYFPMIGSAFATGMGFIIWIIATRLYDADAIGLGSAAISAAQLLVIFSELGLATGLVRFLPGSDKNGNQMINTCITLSGIVAIAISIIFLSGLRIWSPAMLPLLDYTFFSGAFIIFTLALAYEPLMGCVFLARRNTVYILIQDVIIGILKIVLIVLFALFYNNAAGIFSVTGIPMVIVMLLGIIWFFPRVQKGYRPFPQIKLDVVRQLGSYALGNYIGRIFIQASVYIMPLMVVNILGAEANAFFYVALMVTITLRIIPMSVFNSLFTEASNIEDSLNTNCRKSLRLMIWLLLPAELLIVLFADKILLLFGQEYSDNATLILRIMVISVIPWGVIFLYNTIKRIKKDVGNLIKASASATLLSLILSYIMMLKLGLYGAGAGYLLGQLLIAVVVSVLMWRGKYFHNPTK